MNLTAATQAALANIELALFDVDGTMTDGGLWYGPGGESKCFDVKDGMGLVLIREAGIRIGIISGRTSDPVTVRAKELKISIVHQGVRDKTQSLETICRETGAVPERVLFMGDDVNDLTLLKVVGLSACPADAMPEIRRIVDIVCDSNGGHGAVREICDLLLLARASRASSSSSQSNS